MGWTGTKRPTGVTPLDFIEREAFKPGIVVAKAEAGKTCYFAVKVDNPTEWLAKLYEPAADGSITYAVVVLYEDDAGRFGFRWKDMDECMGPYCGGKCPANVLKMLSPLKTDGSYAKAWRARQKAIAEVGAAMEATA